MPGAVHQVHAFVVPAATANQEISTIFLEFGLLILGLGIIARLARRWEIWKERKDSIRHKNRKDK